MMGFISSDDFTASFRRFPERDCLEIDQSEWNHRTLSYWALSRLSGTRRQLTKTTLPWSRRAWEEAYEFESHVGAITRLHFRRTVLRIASASAQDSRTSMCSCRSQNEIFERIMDSPRIFGSTVTHVRVPRKRRPWRFPRSSFQTSWEAVRPLRAAGRDGGPGRDHGHSPAASFRARRERERVPHVTKEIPDKIGDIQFSGALF